MQVRLDYMDSEESVLHFAARYRKAEMLDMLLSHNDLAADINDISRPRFRHEQQVTALQIACHQSDVASVKVLLKHGAKWFIHHPETRSPLRSPDIRIRSIIINHGVFHHCHGYMGCIDSYLTYNMHSSEAGVLRGLLDELLSDIKEHYVTVGDATDTDAIVCSDNHLDLTTINGEGLLGLLLNDLSMLCKRTCEIVGWLDCNYNYLTSVHTLTQLLTALLELSLRESCKDCIMLLISRNARMSATGTSCQLDRQLTFDMVQKLEGLMFFFSQSIDMSYHVIHTEFTLIDDSIRQEDVVVLKALIKAGGLQQTRVRDERHALSRSDLFFTFCYCWFWELAGLMYCDGHRIGTFNSQMLMFNHYFGQPPDDPDVLMHYTNCAIANKTTDNTFLSCIIQMRIQPRSLQNISVIAIRRALHGSILYNVNKLKIPHRLRKLITLDLI